MAANVQELLGYLKPEEALSRWVHVAKYAMEQRGPAGAPQAAAYSAA